MRYQQYAKKGILNIILIFACITLYSLPIAQSNDNSSYYGTITGIVSPLEVNATIYLIKSNSDPSNLSIIDSFEVSLNGTYSFQVKPGMYDVIVISNNGYTNKTLRYVGVIANNTTENPILYMSKIGETGLLSGHVIPVIPDLKIYIKIRFDDKYYGYTLTNEQGIFEFPELAYNTYSIYVPYNNEFDFLPYRWNKIDVNSDNRNITISIVFTPLNATFIWDEIIVDFADELSYNDIQQLVKSLNCSIENHYSYSTSYTIKIPTNTTPDEMVELYSNLPYVDSATVNRIIGLAEPLDNTYPSQIDNSPLLYLDHSANIMDEIEDLHYKKKGGEKKESNIVGYSDDSIIVSQCKNTSKVIQNVSEKDIGESIFIKIYRYILNLF